MARQSLSPMKDLEYERAYSETEDAVTAGNKKGTMTHLKYLRKRSGYTLEALSEVTSISISYLSRLESGSRRLNTDLIRRLSHAFACDPAELLQETSHDSRIITPVDFTRKGRMSFRSSAEKAIDNVKEIPVYQMSKSDNTLKINMDTPVDWRRKPVEFSAHKDVVAVTSDVAIDPYISMNSVVFLKPTGNEISPESTILVVQDGNVMIKKVWSVTPTSLHVCDISEMESLKIGKVDAQTRLMELNKSSVSALYRVLGYLVFE